nr:clostripain-related cysteine peptidase [Anaerolineae bacterium]
MHPKLFIRICIVVMMSLFFITNITAQDGKSWTFLVYIAADNDLEQFALEDIAQMIEVGSSDEVNIVIQIDRAEGYSSDWADFTDTRRFYVTKQASLGELRSIEQLGEVDMSDPQSLTDFIVWGATNYPAEKYSLIIWSHGGGWNGIGPDYGNDQSMLSIAEIDLALANARELTGIDQFEFVAFDACLMAQLEVFQALADDAKYGIAAEEVIPGNGYNYTPILNYLVNNPNTTVEDFLPVIVDSYMEFYATVTTNYRFFDLHTFDLSVLDVVDSALADFVTVANANMTDVFNAIGVARVGAQNFSYASDFQFVDMIDVMSLIVKGSQNADVQASAQAVIDAVTNAVFYTRTTDNMPNAKGLSVYFPILADTFNKDAYVASGVTPVMAEEWVSFLNTFHATATEILANNNVSITVTNTSYISDTVSVLTPPTISFETTGTAIIDLQYVALYQNPTGGQIIVAQAPLAIYTQDIEGNLRSSYPDGDYSSFYTWDVLMSYMDINGEKTPILLEYQTRSAQFKMDGIFCWVANEICTQASVFFDSATRQMASLWVTVDTGNGQVTAAVKPNSGDTFTPSLATITPDGEIQNISQPAQIVFGDETPSFYYAPAQSGDYSILLLIRDLTGEYQAANAFITVNNDDMPQDVRGFPEAEQLGVNFAYPIVWGDSVIQDLGDGNYRYYVSNEDLSAYIYLELLAGNSLDDAYANLEGFIMETVTPLQDP